MIFLALQLSETHLEALISGKGLHDQLAGLLEEILILIEQMLWNYPSLDMKVG